MTKITSTINIPTSASEVTAEWVALVAAREAGLDQEPFEVATAEVRAEKSCEGVLSDFCKAYVRLESKGSRPKLASYFVKVTPLRPQMREIVTRHKLFSREISFYQ